MKNWLFRTTFGFALLSVVVSSCKKDTSEGNDEEVITSMVLTFVPVGGGATLTYQYDDADGPGGAVPTQDQIVLPPSKVYNVTVQLLNKTKMPVGDVTTEVQMESQAHRFYFEPTPTGSITVSGFDTDVNGVPLGIKSVWTSGSVSTGKNKNYSPSLSRKPAGKSNE